jgi:hypothetical protein
MKTNLYVPEKLKVGYNTRHDTYTGKLAYVIYYDNTGKLRKEVSFESWRDKKIDPTEFDNEELEGFVLNRNVGGYKSSWNYRSEYVRVYDPRGFEIEISMGNMLYILEHCNSIKGKGLEGKFIYAWDKTELILVPTNAPDYAEIKKFAAKINLTNKISADDLKEGHQYVTQSGQVLLYMGRHKTLKEYGPTRYKSNIYVMKYKDRISNLTDNSYWFFKLHGNDVHPSTNIEKDKIYTFEYISKKSVTSSVLYKYNDTVHESFAKIYEFLFENDGVFDTIDENSDVIYLNWNAEHIMQNMLEFVVDYPKRIVNLKLYNDNKEQVNLFIINRSDDVGYYSSMYEITFVKDGHKMIIPDKSRVENVLFEMFSGIGNNLYFKTHMSKQGHQVIREVSYTNPKKTK